MSNIPVYVVANFEIEDADIYRVYEKSFFRILRRHGGQFLTYDDATENFEGFEQLSFEAPTLGETAAKFNGGSDSLRSSRLFKLIDSRTHLTASDCETQQQVCKLELHRPEIRVDSNCF